VLSTTPDLRIAAAMYDVDVFDTPAATVARIHAKGRRAICYIDAGTRESWRRTPGGSQTRSKGGGMAGPASAGSISDSSTSSGRSSRSGSTSVGARASTASISVSRGPGREWALGYVPARPAPGLTGTD
jgi:hypothetical protein